MSAAAASPSQVVELVASSLPAYDPQPSRLQLPAGDDLVRSGLGYRWVRGPGGVQLLRPPASVPCAPSSQPAYVYTAARWSKGPHRVAVLRRDAHYPARPIGTPQTRSYPNIVQTLPTRLVHCGDHTRLTYVVTTAGRSQRVSFAVARTAAPREVGAPQGPVAVSPVAGPGSSGACPAKPPSP